MLEEHELHFELGAGRTPCGGCRACNTKQRGGGLGAPAGGLPRQGWAPCRWPGYRGQRGGICLRLLKHGGQSGFPPLLPGLTASPGQGTARPGAARPVSPPLPAAAGRDRGGLRRAGEPPVARGMAARNPGTELGKGLGPRGGQGRGETTRGGGGPASGLPSGSLPPRLRGPVGLPPVPAASRRVSGAAGLPLLPPKREAGPRGGGAWSSRPVRPVPVRLSAHACFKCTKRWWWWLPSRSALPACLEGLGHSRARGTCGHGMQSGWVPSCAPSSETFCCCCSLLSFSPPRVSKYF